MGFLQDLISRGQKAAKAYAGDATFLMGAAAAAALGPPAARHRDEGAVSAARAGLPAPPRH